MRVLISGASGLIGSALVARLSTTSPERGAPPGPHEIFRLVRTAPKPGAAEIPWDPQAQRLDPASLEGLDAVVHLAGENVGHGRWSPEKKARIRDSRVEGTRLLARTLAQLQRPPKALLSASAIGYYGDRGEEELDESSAPGSGFLADVCREWEAATEPARAAGIRVATMRFGIVLSPHGGALAQMLPLFRRGIGGPLASGRQYVSWITLDDAVATILFLLENEDFQGPVNLVAPEPVMNRRFAEALGRAVHRPALVPVPAFALRLMLGEMADEMLLSSAKVLPRRLMKAEFAFRDPTMDDALGRLLERRT